MAKFLCGVALAAMLAVPAAAQDDTAGGEYEIVDTARDGLRIEGRAMFESISDPEEDEDIVYELGQAVSFGGEVGYDIAVSDNVTVGPFVTYEKSGVESCSDGDAFCVRANDFLAIGAQVGFGGLTSQFYAKAAYTRLSVEAEGVIDDGFGQPFAVDEEVTGDGFQIAVGYEFGFGDNLYGRAEVAAGENYNIFDLDFQRVTAGVALGARF